MKSLLDKIFKKTKDIIETMEDPNDLIAGRLFLSTFDEKLQNLEDRLATSQPNNTPELLRDIPLDIFGMLLLGIPDKYPSIKKFFPSMPSKQVQIDWTGTHGDVLLPMSLAFIKSLASSYMSVTGKPLTNAKILDYGCGWGRLIRLLFKFTSADDIYGVDPWDKSIILCREQGIRANLAISDWVPRSLPFDCRFDVIFAFSVFTHLSEKTAHVVLDTLRKYITDDGLLAITIRPKEYWNIHADRSVAPAMLAAHEAKGYAFTPIPLNMTDGEYTYGDTSMSIEHLKNNAPGWKIVTVDYNAVDPYQLIVFLTPV